MNTRTKQRVATGAIIGFTAGALFASCAQEAHADTSVVFVGGTGTGMVPHNPNVGAGFTKPFVPDVGTATSVLYPGAPWDNPGKGVPAVQSAIQAAEGPVVAICLSKGAQVCQTAEPTMPTGVDMIYIGNPNNSSGVSRRLGFSPPAVPPTHNVTEVFAEYDGVADWPDRFTGGLAELNALMGWAVDHTQYGNGTPRDPLTRLDEAEVTVTQNPNGTSTTRMMIPTHALPLTRPLRDVEHGLTGRTVITDRIDGVLRPIIDSGYSRNDRTERPERGSGKSERVSDRKAERAERRANRSKSVE